MIEKPLLESQSARSVSASVAGEVSGGMAAQCLGILLDSMSIGEVMLYAPLLTTQFTLDGCDGCFSPDLDWIFSSSQCSDAGTASIGSQGAVGIPCDHYFESCSGLWHVDSLPGQRTTTPFIQLFSKDSLAARSSALRCS